MEAACLSQQSAARDEKKERSSLLLPFHESVCANGSGTADQQSPLSLRVA